MTTPLDYDRATTVYHVLDVFPSVISADPPLPLLPQRRVRTVIASPTPRYADADHLDLYVFADLAPPGLLHRDRLSPSPGYPRLSPGTPITLAADTGTPTTYTITTDGSCGCGSRLKNWRPFNSWARARP